MSGLGLPTGGGGDFVPYCKYNAKAGRWYTKNDAGEEFEVQNFKAYFDFPNIKTGLFKFAAGEAPEQRFDSAVGTGDAADGGDPKFKRGFQLNVFNPKALGGVREFSSTAGAVNGQMNMLYGAYAEAPEAKEGKIPMVECTGVTPVESKHGINYEPQLKIVKWGARPDDFDAVGGAEEAAPAPAQTPPPAAPDDDEEF